MIEEVETFDYAGFLGAQESNILWIQNQDCFESSERRRDFNWNAKLCWINMILLSNLIYRGIKANIN